MNTQVKSVSVTVEPTPANVASALVIDASGNVSFGETYAKSGFGVRGLIVFGAHNVNTSNSAGIIAANTFRLARKLPDIEVGDKKMSAFNFAISEVRALLHSESAFQNVQGLIPKLDFIDANSELKGCSPFKLKESWNVLNKLGLFDVKTLKLKSGSGKNPVVKALKDNTGLNAMRPIIQAVKKANPALFPTGGRAKSEVVDVSKTVQQRSDEAVTIPPAEKLTVDSVARMFQSAIGAWDKLISESKAPGNDLLALQVALGKFGLVRQTEKLQGAAALKK